MRAFDGSSSLLYFSIEVTKIVFHLLRKMGYDGQFIGDLKLGSQLFHPLFQSLSVSRF